MRRHPELSLRQAEATSITRAKGFNRESVHEFYDKLETLVDTYWFDATNIFNVDESGITTVQKPGRVFGKIGKRQIGSLTSGERGFTTTVVCSMTAGGNYVPPMIIFRRKRIIESLEASKWIMNQAGWTRNSSSSGWRTLYLMLAAPKTNMFCWFLMVIRHTRKILKQSITPGTMESSYYIFLHTQRTVSNPLIGFSINLWWPITMWNVTLGWGPNKLQSPSPQSVVSSEGHTYALFPW